MKREIKFRGKPTSKSLWGEWVYGFYLQDLSNGKVKDFIFSCPSEIEVIPETVGQFTGLHDKNGKEVYEGDILRYPPKSDWDKENYAAYKVFWYDNDSAYCHVGWRMKRVHYKGVICGDYIPNFLPENVSKMVVIDNPELLKTE